MRVQRVIMPITGSVSWTVVDDRMSPVAPAERFLAHLAAIERSPNTVRAYAFGLRLWFEYLESRGVMWDDVGIEELSRFVGWLRAPAENVIVIDESSAVRSEATVNRHLAAVFGLYDFHARSGLAVPEGFDVWRRVPRGSYKPFLHHVTAGRTVRTRPVKLRTARRLPRTLDGEQIAAIVEACDRLRDRFLVVLLAESAMRVGQALGLRHGDIVSRERRILVVPRDDNVNGARAKCREPVELPVSSSLIRLYSEYLHTEYGSLESDYVFVNLWSAPLGRPLRYDAVAKLVVRLRKRTGIDFNLHMLRHSRATELVRAGTPIEVVSKLLTHRSVTTTSAAYVHLDAADIRAELVRAGAWAEST